MRINTNILSLQAQRSLSQTTKALSRALERLSTGKRINRAADDATGLGRATTHEAQTRGLARAIQNMNEAGGFLATAEGAMSTQISLIQRMRELAVQAANGTLSSTDRSYLDNELQTLVQEYHRIANETEFSGVKLLDGSFATRNLQVGTQKTDQIAMSIASTQAQNIFTELRPSGSFLQSTTIERPDGNAPEIMLDFNSDGHLDLLSTINSGGGSEELFFGNGDGTFGSSMTLQLGVVMNMRSSDLNQDGNQDVIVNENSEFRVYSGDGAGNLSLSFTLTAGVNITSFETADMNNDGDDDIIAISDISDEVYFFAGNGDGTFDTAITKITGIALDQLNVGDVNNDGLMDFVLNDEALNNVDVYLGLGNWGFKGDSSFAVNSSFNSSSLVDVDSDGNLDLAWLDATTTGRVLVNYGTESGTFAPLTTIASGGTGTDHTAGLHIKDMNADGYLDFIYMDDNRVANIVYGQGGRSFATQVSVGASGASLNHVVDINKDGYLDLVIDEVGVGVNEYIFLQDTESASAVDALNVSTQDNATRLLEILDTALSNMSAQRSQLGALQNRIDVALNNGQSILENVHEARSGILDTDYAKETADLVHLQIMQQAGISALSQANSSLQIALSLLR